MADVRREAEGAPRAERAPKAERERLAEAARRERPWKKWGPYLSERQWGTVRENATRGVEAWNEVSHDQARSRAYLSGEDGLCGFCDDQLLLCFALGLWNGRDPILKERLFGLTNSEGNHGEDVKEYYFYLDSAPTHSYAKMLYKYPQAAFPYDAAGGGERATLAHGPRVRAARHRRLRRRPLLGRLPRGGQGRSGGHVGSASRPRTSGPEPATLHVLPHLWFREHLGAGLDRAAPAAGGRPPRAQPGDRRPPRPSWARASSTARGRASCCSRTTKPTAIGCSASPTPPPFEKDGINDYVVNGRRDAVNPKRHGTKSAAHYLRTVRSRRQLADPTAPQPASRRASWPSRSATFEQTSVEPRSARPTPSTPTSSTPS